MGKKFKMKAVIHLRRLSVIFLSLMSLFLALSVFSLFFSNKASGIESTTPKLRVLEIVSRTGASSILQANKILEQTVGTKYEYTIMPIKQFVAQREELDGLYDVIAIMGTNFSSTGVQNREHNTTNVMNDITRLKADEIIEDFIKKGQPVIIDSRSVSSSSGNVLNDAFSKYTNRNPNNLFIYDNRNNNTNTNTTFRNNFTTFINSYKQAPRFSLTRKPSESTKYTPSQSLDFEIKMQVPTNLNNSSLQARLYIDADFNDRYSPDEIVVEKSITSSTTGLSYLLPRGYSGVRNWKLEVIDMGTNLKSYQKGMVYFKDQIVELNVLQVMGSTTSSSLKSENNLRQSYLSTDEYKINIDVTNMSEFNKTNTSNASYSHEKLNGKYDMVIFGFQDSYNLNAKINQNAATSVKNFINTNQSVMFTHDTIFEQSGDENNLWVKNFMEETGQIKPKTNLGYGAPSLSTRTGKVNEGLITNYPFKLNDSINIASTHNQYFTLDLEDPNVTPWYNITGSSRDVNDSWNHYYTYSKGNITYSGSGHTSAGFPDEEQRLFVNTMYRAFLGSNHAPIITVINPQVDNEVIPAHHKVELAYTIQDFDLKDKKLSTKVFLGDKLVYEEDDVTNGSTIVQTIDHQKPNGGAETLRIEAIDSQGAKVEKIINLKIEKINANLEVSRTISSQGVIPVDSEVQIQYNINPKEVTGEAAKKITADEKLITDVQFSETFPPNVEVIVPTGFNKSGTLQTGYTISGILSDVQYIRQGDKFVAQPSSFTIKIIPKDKNISTLNSAQVNYTDINDEQTIVRFNSLTIQSDYKLDRVELPQNMVINKGIPKNLTLDLKIYPEKVGIKDINWSVIEGQDIITIDPKTGVVIANGKGSGYVKVVVTDVFGNKKEAITYITVRIPIDSIILEDITIKVGEEKNIPIKIETTENDNDAINGVTFELTNPNVASIDKEHRKILGIEPGEATIRAWGLDKDGNVVEAIARLIVEEISVERITVSPNPVSIQKFEEYDNFDVRIFPENATDKTLNWESRNPSIVQVIKNGEIKGVATGSAEVVVSTRDGKVSTTVMIHVGLPLEGISASSIKIKKGTTDDANKYYKKHPADATNVKGSPSFVSSDENIVEVDANGTIYAKRLGTAKIYITVWDDRDNSYSAELIVHVTEEGNDSKDLSGDKY